MFTFAQQPVFPASGGEPRTANKVRELPPDESLPLLPYAVEYGGAGGKLVCICPSKAVADKIAEILNFYQRPTG
jgi:hypothetical protein